MSSIQTIIRPVFTEKSMALSTEGQYTFEVHEQANKQEIAKEVNRLFDVEVSGVKTHIRPGKEKRILRQRRFTRTAPRKFAVVRLVEGQTIAGFDKLLEVEDGD